MVGLVVELLRDVPREAPIPGVRGRVSNPLEIVPEGTRLVVVSRKRGARASGGNTLTLAYLPDCNGVFPFAARHVKEEDLRVVGACPLPVMLVGARRYLVEGVRLWCHANGHTLAPSRFRAGGDSVARCTTCGREVWVRRCADDEARYTAEGDPLRQRCA